MQHKVLPPCSPHRVGTQIREGCLFFEKRHPSLTPSQRKFFIASEQLEELQCLPIAPLACGRAAFGPAIRFASASTTRCRSAHLIEVQPNSRLPPVATMRRAPAMPHSAGSLPPDKRHSRLTTVRRGCKRSRLAGVHGEAMYTAPTLRSACSHSSARLPM